MKKLLALLVVIALALMGYVAAGPFMTVHAIREAVKAQDTAALARHVDFPALRGNLRAQAEDYIARQAGADVQSHPLGAIALGVASSMAGVGIDAMATPAGIGALLEGRNFIDRVSGRRNNADTSTPAPPRDPLKGAKYDFESTSRFTATVVDGDGRPVMVVFTRDGLTWKLSDIRLPLQD